MELLFVNACVRGKSVSRTYALARAFLDEYGKHRPDVEVYEESLSETARMPFDETRLARRDMLIDEKRWDDPMFKAAVRLRDADMVVVAAPYWDFSFPACLKTYVEHIFVRDLTFYYNETGPVGLLRARNMVYITTSGSPIALGMNHGGDYMATVAKVLGVPEFHQLSAEGLDIDGADVPRILGDARADAERLAGTI